MTHGSLFSGIGGFDLAALWMGWSNEFHCEINDFGRKILNYHFPNAKSYKDIKDTDFTIWRGRIDVLSGGFPCQPFSIGGKQLGTEDERHLWPEMLRAVREIQPQWVVGENVRGLINWSDGLVFEQVQTDLEAEGYEVTPYILPACSVDAPHRRDRIWFVAYSEGKNDRGDKRGEKKRQVQQFGERLEPTTITDSKHNGHTTTKGGRGNGEAGTRPQEGTNSTEQSEGVREPSKLGGLPNVTDSKGEGLQGSKIIGGTSSLREDRDKQPARCIQPNFENFPTQSPIRGRNDGIPDIMDNAAFSKWRNESIKAYGNAIVPQIAFKIFKAIQDYEQAATTSIHPKS